ncbi:TPA: conjugal transfer protein TrbD [Enterobacter hormaechei subsp. steigerwaltii]|nr:conjugal transfer protein [Salmonella enterica]EDK5405662.1 conjugal transfer protein [Salmonella enterica subsp. enterica serovar Newport]EFE6523778.1 conjugal transfer protein [Escherichia coli]EAX5070737.1 conjugal transfer protein [Salmonella enterica]HBC7587910.1 conjugal transfer protein TrbD [Escherichia coli]
MALRTIPIRRVASRSNLFMGGDREMVMFSILLAAVLIFTSQDWIAAGVGVAIWGVSLALLRRMAKSDPMLRQVYLRSLKYSQAHYAPRATPFRINTTAQGNRYK